MCIMYVLDGVIISEKDLWIYGALIKVKITSVQPNSN